MHFIIRHFQQQSFQKIFSAAPFLANSLQTAESSSRLRRREKNSSFGKFPYLLYWLVVYLMNIVYNKSYDDSVKL